MVSESVLIALIAIVPSVLWTLLVAVLIAIFHRTLRTQLLPRLTRFDIFGIEATFLEERMNRAIAHRRVRVSEDDRAGALRRLRGSARVFRGAVVLWVDPAPDETTDERAMLRQAGASIDMARSASEARASLAAEGHDVVIVRVAAGEDPAAAIAILAEAGRSEGDRSLILYVPAAGGERGAPAGVFATADRPDRLLHYVVDVLERRCCQATFRAAR